ncbi:uncharacterized protein LOC132305564 [Cornus florida]|uniref:uncharacterized protein LOC132305564 n=1 Tax=Cornus florida TaxID=4283 RepID=UPI00289CE7EF|nr:uncharacterized protein LOC132305564 [Cornus florida]
MPKKRSPIFQKVSNLLKLSILIAKMRKPIIPKLIFIKKSTSRLKKFKLLKHYNNGYIQEYQFSPSNTPLIHYYHSQQPIKKKSNRDIYSMFFLCRCLGDVESPLETLPGIEDEVLTRELSEFSDSGGEEDSVDEKAERFIERFYEEMRKQRQESTLQLS